MPMLWRKSKSSSTYCHCRQGGPAVLLEDAHVVAEQSVETR
jgi:hypothetical protein